MVTPGRLVGKMNSLMPRCWGASGSVLAFVRPYFPKDISNQLEEDKFAVEYMDYDWALNDRKASDPP